jgi:Fic family protein
MELTKGGRNMPYKPPYTITPIMLDRISEIMKRIGQLSIKANLDHLPKLRRSNQIQSIYSSLAIENNALTIKQVTDLVNGKLVVGPNRDIIEVKNAIRVYDDILIINPYDMNCLLKYHGMMMASLVDDAGMFRSGQEGVFDGNQVIFIAPPANRVLTLMSDLYEYINQVDENILIKSCVFHHKFEFIHPFSDGNGRMGRLIQTCLLASKEKVFAYLPIESIIKERQAEYYQAIAQSNRNGDSNVFIEFMLDALLETVSRVVETSSSEQHLSTQVKRLLAAMKDDTPYTTQELMEILQLKSRTSLKLNYLDPAKAAGLIVMTFPDHPNSRNQRYIKKQP